MWYFAWTLGIGFAVLLAILNVLWGDYEEARTLAPNEHDDAQHEGRTSHPAPGD